MAADAHSATRNPTSCRKAAFKVWTVTIVLGDSTEERGALWQPDTKEVFSLG